MDMFFGIVLNNCIVGGVSFNRVGVYLENTVAFSNNTESSSRV